MITQDLKYNALWIVSRETVFGSDEDDPVKIAGIAKQIINGDITLPKTIRWKILNKTTGKEYIVEDGEIVNLDNVRYEDEKIPMVRPLQQTPKSGEG